MRLTTADVWLIGFTALAIYLIARAVVAHYREIRHYNKRE
jgi:hypothetical protein